MATLREMEAEKAEIEATLSRMQADESTTEEGDGDLRDTLIARWDALDATMKPIIEQMEKIQSIVRATKRPAAAEAGSDEGGERQWAGQGPEFLRRLDPLSDMEAVEGGRVSRKDMVARASTLIEMREKQRLLLDDRAETATRRAQESGMIARHILMHGSEEYHEAFFDYLRDPTGRGLQRAAGALSLAAAQGGYMLPFILDPTIILTTDGSMNPYRRISRVVRTTSNAWQGVNSAGVNAAYLDEAAAAGTAAYQGVGRISVFPKKAAAWVYGSFEAAEDTNFADQLPALMQDAKDILEESAFAAGTGSNTDNTGTPNGIAHAMGTAQRVAGGLTGANSVYALEAALGARFRMSGSCGWVANLSNINAVRGFSPSGSGSSFWASLGDGTPERLLNRPINESTSLTASTATGTGASGTGSVNLMIGDWDKFIICDRVGMSMIFEPLVKDVTTGAPKGQQGWFAYFRSSSDVATANAFRYLTVG